MAVIVGYIASDEGRAALEHGVAEAIRRAGAEQTPHAVLTRGLVGVVDAADGHPGAVVANLPGSTGGVRDGLAVLLPLVPHLLDQLGGGDHA